MEEMEQPTGEGTIACVQRAGEQYYFPCKLSLEPACKEQEMTRMGTYVQTETIDGTEGLPKLRKEQGNGAII